MQRHCRHVYRQNRGWHVAIRRKGRLRWRYFRDDAHAGRNRALLCALAWRDAQLRRLPPATLIRTRYGPNTTGVVGVQLARDRTRGGRIAPRYRASWYELDGRLRMRSFSVGKYGMTRAKAMAVEVRRQVVQRLLKERKWLTVTAGADALAIRARRSSRGR